MRLLRSRSSHIHRCFFHNTAGERLLLYSNSSFFDGYIIDPDSYQDRLRDTRIETLPSQSSQNPTACQLPARISTLLEKYATNALYMKSLIHRHFTLLFHYSECFTLTKLLMFWLSFLCFGMCAPLLRLMPFSAGACWCCCCCYHLFCTGT